MERTAPRHRTATNFDPLTERALDEIGCTYEVLASTDAIYNALRFHGRRRLAQPQDEAERRLSTDPAARECTRPLLEDRRTSLQTGDHSALSGSWVKVKRMKLRVASKFGPQVMGEGLADRRHAQHVPEDVAIEHKVAFDGLDFFG